LCGHVSGAILFCLCVDTCLGCVSFKWCKLQDGALLATAALAAGLWASCLRTCIICLSAETVREAQCAQQQLLLCVRCGLQLNEFCARRALGFESCVCLVRALMRSFADCALSCSPSSSCCCHSKAFSACRPPFLLQRGCAQAEGCAMQCVGSGQQTVHAYQISSGVRLL
jgi:hypothetical protein